MYKYLILLCTISMFSCVKGKEMKILRIAPDTIRCNNEDSERECLKVKWTTDQEEWEVFESNIKGFAYEPGFSYILRVTHADKDKPEQWNLVKLIEKQKVCKGHLSEEEILNILDAKGLILKPEGADEEEIAKATTHAPILKLNLEKCIWRLISSVYEPITYEDTNCTETNGCIPEVILTVEVHARTAELLYESKERVLHPNYE